MSSHIKPDQITVLILTRPTLFYQRYSLLFKTVVQDRFQMGNCGCMNLSPLILPLHPSIIQCDKIHSMYQINNITPQIIRPSLSPQFQKLYMSSDLTHGNT